MAKMWAVRVSLSEGGSRILAASTGAVEHATACLTDLQQGTGDFADEWLETTEPTIVARSHIVEAHVVPL